MGWRGGVARETSYRSAPLPHAVYYSRAGTAAPWATVAMAAFVYAPRWGGIVP